MGVLQSIFRSWRSGREDEESSGELNPILDHYQKPSNGGSFRALLCIIFKNLLRRISNIRLFSKPRKPEPILPVVNPVVSTRYHGSSAIQEISSASSDSSSDSSPGATYVPPSDLERQRNYSDIENESPPPDLVLQRDYSNSENEVYANAAWLQNPPVSSAIRTESLEVDDSNYIKQLNVIIDVPTFNCSLAHKNAFDVVDSAVFIENEKNQLEPSDSREEVEEEKVINCLVAEGKWIKHYNSYHRILLVGEGDFSFSASLAVAYGSASNMIATSLDSVDFLKENYKRAMSNIGKLRSRECIVMHGIDATKVASHHFLGGMTFDRIIFNFPFAGFFKDLSREAQLRKHRRLVSLFLKNAKEMIGENGEIHISHKTNGFHEEWMLESVASSHRLGLIEAVEFNRFDYEGYNTKCGFGGDKNFHCYPSKTYKFGLKRAQFHLLS
ncbi:uncharacterized protein LOC111395807 isoform X1 [Olea europaea var. sylvestris]|uniref:uncharacterized protein LOC111395807 isoform X1 n=1 Tax=Olea europaea var. sylvestris TaxID=158386 RepID=UPI000C1D4865|nr:uncharacterized protein LOC111395807 isoform X1 [Olea europaea var. sylvestris]XP_022877732.1 uncharacterized protein LOC111395807 isoform X1 [Olea europaea var. sylvestris]